MKTAWAARPKATLRPLPCLRLKPQRLSHRRTIASMRRGSQLTGFWLRQLRLRSCPLPRRLRLLNVIQAIRRSAFHRRLPISVAAIFLTSIFLCFRPIRMSSTKTSMAPDANLPSGRTWPSAIRFYSAGQPTKCSIVHSCCWTWKLRRVANGEGTPAGASESTKNMWIRSRITSGSNRTAGVDRGEL